MFEIDSTDAVLTTFLFIAIFLAYGKYSCNKNGCKK